MMLLCEGVCFEWPYISAIRHLEENLDDWLTDELDNYLDDDYLVFDCPGIHAHVYLID